MSAYDLFEFAVKNIPSVAIKFTREADHQREAESLEERFSLGCTIKGTLRLHAFIPVSSTSLDAKDFSLSEESRRVCVAEEDLSPELDVSEIRGYVTAIWNGQWLMS
ncbi:MAG: hypothetical protein GY696_08120 [Gammaproteobacteria bacterium]|nr:hypothetical protein [Gammaproteobacteria bacterium]